MPLTRYLVRNEYGLADPEVYRGADRDDPEAILEGVAMAGLVGVLRQLGDLAQFAAEIFHDLHEEVMATAERGHGLMARVQQLEAEIPSIEKAFLSQTDHSSFFSSAGVDWHPNLHMEQSLITRGDLPRFVMNSYEECRGPPRLFLLDKFDVAGAGACLKRYTDPSFFKVEAASSEMAAVGIQREKKARKVKKKGSRWRNGDTPEVVPTSHAKLHQLFLEERVENGHPDPARLVKLKRRQLNRSACDLKAGKSYMEKFLETPSPDHKVVHEVSATLPLLKLTSDNSSESGLEILDIRVVSPVKRSSPGEERTLTLPNTQEVIVKPFMDELNGEVANGRIMKASVPSVDDEMDESPIFRKIETEQELAVNVEDKTEGSLDGDHSDDMASDVDNFMDALTTMESEMETDNEYKYKNSQGFLNVEKGGMDSDASVEQPDIESNFSDSQSIGISSASDDGNNSFKKERFSSSYSDSLGNIAENIPSDSEGAAKVPYVENSKDGVVNSSSDHPSICADRLGSKFHELVVRNYTCSEEDKISDPGEVSRESYLAGSNPMLQPSVPEANSMNSFVRPELEETPFDSTKIGSRLPDIDKKGENLYDSSLIMSGVPLQTSNDTSFTVSSESRPVDESDHEISDVSSDGFVHTSNTLELNHGTEGSDDSVIATENCVDNLVEVDKGASVSSILDSSEFDSVSEVDAVAGMELNFDNSMVDTSETCSIKEQQCSDIIADISQVEVDSAEVGVSYSEEKRTTEVTAGYTGKVDSAKVDGAPCEHLSDDLHKLGLKDHVSTDDVAVEAFAPVDDTNDDINNILSIPLDLTSCSSRNLEDMEKSVCGFEYTQQRVLDLHEANSPKCLSESKVQKDVEQLEVAPTNLGSVLDALVSDGRCNQEATKQFYNPPLAEQAQINSYVSDGTTAPSSERNHELESKPTYRSHSADTGEDDLRPPTCLPEAGASLHESVAQADQIDVQTVHPSIDEVPNSSNLHTSPTCSVAEPQIPLGQMSELHNDILDRNSSHADEAHSTISSNFQSEHMESVCHADYESYTDTSASCPGDLSGQELLLQSTGREFCRTMLAWNPFDSSNPTFSSMPETTQVNLEAMPPLPPLPPIQWRIGKIQPNPLAAQREPIDHTQGSFPLTQPFASDNKAQFPLSDREIVQSSNPFLSFDLADRQRSQHSSADSVGSSLQSTPLLLEIPAIGTNANGQQEGVPIEGTQSLNPFFTSAEIHNKKTEHGSLGLGGESIQSNSNSSSQAPRTEHTTSGRDPLPSHSHSGKQLATETGVEVKVPEHSSQNSAREQGNSPDKLVISQTLGGEQQHDLVTSSEETAWSPDTTLALPPTYEAGKLNGKKLPRPRNPLIDAVAAHDKSKLRKVTERVRPRIGPMAEERDSLLEQIRSKSFNLKPAPSTRPSIQGVQGPKTNLKVAAILQKATAIRQALTGSDEDDDSDSWSDS